MWDILQCDLQVDYERQWQGSFQWVGWNITPWVLCVETVVRDQNTFEFIGPDKWLGPQGLGTCLFIAVFIQHPLSSIYYSTWHAQQSLSIQTSAHAFCILDIVLSVGRSIKVRKSDILFTLNIFSPSLFVFSSYIYYIPSIILKASMCSLKPQKKSMRQTQAIFPDALFVFELMWVGCRKMLWKLELSSLYAIGPFIAVCYDHPLTEMVLSTATWYLPVL